MRIERQEIDLHGNAGEQARAYACFDELFRRGQGEGFMPYRLSIREMDRLADASQPCGQMVRRIKAAIDPQGLIAPGRYGG